MQMTVFKTITNRLVEKDVIKEEDKPIYQYGLEQGALVLLFVLTTIAMGVIFQLVWESLVFFVAYSVLRMHAGGKHAKTLLNCYVISVFITIGVLAAIAVIPYSYWLVGGISISASVMILILAPVETENKPLDEKEVMVYRKRTQIILTVELCILAGSMFIGAKHVAMCITLAILLAFIMVALGKITNK